VPRTVGLVGAIDVEQVALCCRYRDRRGDETDAGYGQRPPDELDVTIRRTGPEEVVAFVVETVGGATAGGAITPCSPRRSSSRRRCRT
jgi:adenosylmethionine-8-amino-7-oxononanoate aminotransferase